MNIEISPGKVFKVLLATIGVLFIANVIGVIVRIVLDLGDVRGLVYLTDFDKEGNLPTLLSSTLLFGAAFLLWINGIQSKYSGNRHGYWIFLSLIFVYLAVDESVQLHERLDNISRDIFETSGYFYFAWVIPYGVGLLVLFAYLINFLRTLPRRTALRFLVSGAVYVSGALGLEMMGAKQYELVGQKDLLFAIFYSFEELLEMIGVTLFIHALLSYSAGESRCLRITFVNDG